MGRANKRMKRQQARQRQAAAQAQNRVTEAQLTEQFAAHQYDKALETLAQLIKAGDTKPEYLYKGAYSYFMLGDQERAAQWVSNTLAYAPEHVDARILLARICITQQREDDALAILDFLAEQDGDSLKPEQAQTIRDIGSYYARTEPAKLQQDFPHIAAFLQASVPEAPVSLTSEPQAPTTAVAPASASYQAESPTSAVDAAPATATVSGTAATPVAQDGDTLAMLRRLKAKVQGANAAMSPAANTRALTGAVGQAATGAGTASNASVMQPAPAAVAQSQVPATSTAAAPQVTAHSSVTAQEQIAAVMAKEVSLHEKINLLNAFAGAAFVADDYATAKAELEAALKLDSEDAATIRNLALTVALQGDKEKALAIAARQQPVAFMLLHAIKQL